MLFIYIPHGTIRANSSIVSKIQTSALTKIDFFTKFMLARKQNQYHIGDYHEQRTGCRRKPHYAAPYLRSAYNYHRLSRLCRRARDTFQYSDACLRPSNPARTVARTVGIRLHHMHCANGGDTGYGPPATPKNIVEDINHCAIKIKKRNN